MTGFGSFDNSTCKKVLNCWGPGDLRVGKVAVVAESCSSQAWSEPGAPARFQAKVGKHFLSFPTLVFSLPTLD